MHPGVASWYSYESGVACPWDAPTDRLAVASLQVPCGTKVRLCSTGCVTAVVDDHGPYVSGRIFDLDPAVKEAIRCSDLCGREGTSFTWGIVK
jgi:hypothetical protein